MMTQQHDAPVSITTARDSRSDDIRRRQIKYLVSMGIRTVCFVLAVVFSGPLRWVFVAAAFALPYFAVVLANAADSRTRPAPARFFFSHRREITSGADTGDPGAASEGPHGSSER